jgi:hypothetical protein
VEGFVTNSMMYVLCSPLMSVVLTLHTVLGCCWHHAHACTQECSTRTAVASPNAPAGECGDECAASDGADHSHHGPHECKGNSCVFLNLAGRSALGSTPHSEVPAVSCLPCVALPIDTAAGASFFAIDALLPPLRLHLAQRVLLL